LFHHLYREILLQFHDCMLSRGDSPGTDSCIVLHDSLAAVTTDGIEESPLRVLGSVIMLVGGSDITNYLVLSDNKSLPLSTIYYPRSGVGQLIDQEVAFQRFCPPARTGSG